mmetsp:Transcript_17918/g.50937  ORF Transcript_17918/g.50937 Transcript_17918/m.50937 type:complete len:98 (+) Transcript_17918:77-370(+)
MPSNCIRERHPRGVLAPWHNNLLSYMPDIWRLEGRNQMHSGTSSIPATCSHFFPFITGFLAGFFTFMAGFFAFVAFMAGFFDFMAAAAFMGDLFSLR